MKTKDTIFVCIYIDDISSSLSFEFWYRNLQISEQKVNPKGWHIWFFREGRVRFGVRIKFFQLFHALGILNLYEDMRMHDILSPSNTLFSAHLMGEKFNFRSGRVHDCRRIIFSNHPWAPYPPLSPEHGLVLYPKPPQLPLTKFARKFPVDWSF